MTSQRIDWFVVAVWGGFAVLGAGFWTAIALVIAGLAS
jgi:hypothetical protein